MNDIKPVAFASDATINTLRNGKAARLYPERTPWLYMPVYIIPPTHRVVGVDFLEKLEALTILAGYKGAHKELGAIIRSKGKS